MRDADKDRRHPNREEKHALRVAEIAQFIRQVGRKSQKGAEPNDRRHDRKLEEMVRRLNPEELDRMLRDDEE